MAVRQLFHGHGRRRHAAAFQVHRGRHQQSELLRHKRPVLRPQLRLFHFGGAFPATAERGGHLRQIRGHPALPDRAHPPSAHARAQPQRVRDPLGRGHVPRRRAQTAFGGEKTQPGRQADQGQAVGAAASRSVLEEHPAQLLSRKDGAARPFFRSGRHPCRPGREGGDAACGRVGGGDRNRQAQDLFRRRAGSEVHAGADLAGKFQRHSAHLFGGSRPQRDDQPPHQAEQGSGRRIGHEDPLSRARLSALVFAGGREGQLCASRLKAGHPQKGERGVGYAISAGTKISPSIPPCSNF